MSGSLSDLSETSLRLLSHGNVQTFSQADVELVRERHGDSLWNGFLIGAAVGIAPSVYWLLADPNECGGSVCPDDLLIGVTIGAAIGAAIDAAFHRKVVVYRRLPASSTERAFTIAPIVAERRKGVELAMSF